MTLRARSAAAGLHPVGNRAGSHSGTPTAPLGAGCQEGEAGVSPGLPWSQTLLITLK